MNKGRRWRKADSGSPSSERKIGRMIEPQWRSKVEACSRIDNAFAGGVLMGEGWREVDSVTVRTRSAHCGDGHCFADSRRTNDQLVAHGKRSATLTTRPIGPADLNIRDTGARIG